VVYFLTEVPLLLAAVAVHRLGDSAGPAPAARADTQEL
jgi:hypothetical protein